MGELFKTQGPGDVAFWILPTTNLCHCWKPPHRVWIREAKCVTLWPRPCGGCGGYSYAISSRIIDPEWEFIGHQIHELDLTKLVPVNVE